MDWFENGLRYVHIGFGFAGLAAFWIPVVARKGGRQHVRFGRIFVRCAYVTLGSAGLAVLYHLGGLLAAGVMPADRPGTFGILVFLGYLALVTAINVRYAVGVLRTKRDPALLRTRLNRALGWVAILSSVFLIAYTVYFWPPNRIVLLALSPVGFGIGSSIIRYLGGRSASPRQWLYEHLGAMLGAGIAFHTAFAVVGAARLFDLSFEGWVAVLPWIAPAAIGIPAITLWTRHYRRKFAELQAA